MRIGSLFSGYGGLDAGVQSVLGGSVAWHVEYDKHPPRSWPTTSPTSQTLATFRLWTGQRWSRSAFSPAATRASRSATPANGKAPTMNDTYGPTSATPLAHYRPRLVVLENVAGHLYLGRPRSCWGIAGWGTAHGGALFELPTPALLIAARDCSSSLPRRRGDGRGDARDVGRPPRSLLPTPKHDRATTDGLGALRRGHATTA